jgi:hypothetical protein
VPPRSIAVLLLAVGCTSDPPARLLVDLKTDLVPGREFSTVITEVWPPAERDAAPGAPMEVRLDAALGETFSLGRRIAELDVTNGTRRLRVTLVDRGGAVRGGRDVIVRVLGTTGVTVLVTRSCVGIECPPAGDPEATTCQSGHCVRPDCTPENPEACTLPPCTRDADCPPSVLCVESLCESGVCLSVPVDARCGEAERCDPSLGCIGAVCGDSICDPAESTCMCSGDCGSACGDGCCTGDENGCGCPADCPTGCGDRCCTGAENTTSCPQDCGTSCPDGACNGGEDTRTCPQDCGSACGDAACNGGEATTTCPQDCGTACGDGACNGVACQPDCGGWDCACQIRCCDDYLDITVTNSDGECLARSVCEGRLGTVRVRRGERLIYERPTPCPDCCAKCRARASAYRMVGVTSMCTEAARTWCDAGSRGGLEDAFWGSCPLPP